ncbi:potassium channel family protein [Micromonospora sp. CNB394]|uniref:potassium channel family protein n=1 Tax=Micromonospora sp. CNB394 TaxID=1169151 RepID=UPI0005601F13|nr:potassium channel family protein [Micromonospora sp. CNB394]
MSVLLVSAGLLVVGAILLDAALTTLSLAGGAGWLTRRVSQGVWRLIRRLAGRGPRRHRLLRWSGTSVLVVTFAAWVTGLWLGWLLVFSATPDAVLDQFGRPADGWSRFYYTGFSIFTLGVGDYTPGNAAAQLATNVAVLTGLFLVTLGITYLMQVVPAVVDKRTIAGHITALGADPADIVRRGWADGQFAPMFTQHLTSLTPELVRLGERHLAFPVLHYFHAGTCGRSASAAVTVLDGALLLVRCGVDPHHRPDVGAVEPLSRALAQLVRTLDGSFIVAADQPVSAPPLQDLTRAGIPTIPEQAYAEAAEGTRTHRCRLRGWCASDGWDDADLRLTLD